jgi:hypothetical protein
VFATDFRIKNTSRAACSLDGWADVALYGNTTMVVCVAGQQDPGCGHPIDTTTRDEPDPVPSGQKPVRQVVAPGRHAEFSLVWKLIAGCAVPAYSARITLPGDSHSVEVVFPDRANPCVEGLDADTAPEPIHVTPLGTTG